MTMMQSSFNVTGKHALQATDPTRAMLPEILSKSFLLMIQIDVEMKDIIDITSRRNGG